MKARRKLPTELLDLASDYLETGYQNHFTNSLWWAVAVKAASWTRAEKFNEVREFELGDNGPIEYNITVIF